MDLNQVLDYGLSVCRRLLATTCRVMPVVLFCFISCNLLIYFVFLLHCLLFKPKFVEVKKRKYAIDRSYSSNETLFTMPTVTPKGFTSAPTASTSNEPIEASDIKLKLLKHLSTHIQQESANPGNCGPSQVFITADRTVVQLKNKIGSGRFGVSYACQTEKGPRNSTKQATCVKLIDYNRLWKIANDANGVCKLPQEGTVADSNNDRHKVLTDRFRTHYEWFQRYFFYLCDKSIPSNWGRHPNINYYQRIWIYYSNSPRSLSNHKCVRDFEQPLFPYNVILVMPLAHLNLRVALIKYADQFPLPTVTAFSKQILMALDFLHNQLLMAHLNLKPENILLFKSAAYRNKSEQFHVRYIIKLTDCAQSYMVPLERNVLSSSHKICKFQMSCFSLVPLQGTLSQRFMFDIHCFSNTMLLMMVGYDKFHNTFAVDQFPFMAVADVNKMLIKVVDEEPQLISPLYLRLLLKLYTNQEAPYPTTGKPLTVREILKDQVFA